MRKVLLGTSGKTTTTTTTSTTSISTIFAVLLLLLLCCYCCNRCDAKSITARPVSTAPNVESNIINSTFPPAEAQSSSSNASVSVALEKSEPDVSEAGSDTPIELTTTGTTEPTPIATPTVTPTTTIASTITVQDVTEPVTEITNTDDRNPNRTETSLVQSFTLAPASTTTSTTSSSLSSPSSLSSTTTSSSSLSLSSTTSTSSLSELSTLTTTSNTSAETPSDSSSIIIAETILGPYAKKNATKVLLKLLNKLTSPSKKDGEEIEPSSAGSSGGNKTNKFDYKIFFPKYLMTKSANVNRGEDYASSGVKANKNKFRDFMPDHIRQNGGVILHILMLVYVCLSLGIICDLYFLTSIEYIGNALKLPADIAGATFMALGTSAPELFVALIGVFIAEDDIGTSTILGSAVFNLIFVPGVCGFAVYFASMSYPKINKYAILRDAIFYMIAITALMLALKDNEIDWLESLCMLSLYSIYVFILYINAQLGELVEIEDEDDQTEDEDKSSDCSGSTIDSGASEVTPLLTDGQKGNFAAATKNRSATSGANLLASLMRSDRYRNFTKSADWIDSEGERRRKRRCGSLLARPIGRTSSIRASSIRNGSTLALPSMELSAELGGGPGSGGYEEIDNDKAARLDNARCKAVGPSAADQYEEPCGMPKNWAESHALLRIVTFPIVLLIKLTVPRPSKSSYFFTFAISILWISGFTYCAVWLVTIIGNTFDLPETVIGLTILAAGASIPEVISSVIVVKRAGLANMALCNLFGSNIFDILLCLGIPWTIKNAINAFRAGSTELAASIVPVQSHGLLLTTFTLLLCVIAFVCTLGFNRWRLGLGVGVMCSTLYFTAISLASVYEILLN